jgi:hypothetical protein
VNRPPQEITPKEFFESWLPAEVPADTRFARPATVRVRLDGDGGGAWDLTLGPQGLAVGPAGDAAPLVETAQSVPDWRAVIVGEPGAPRLTPEGKGGGGGAASLRLLERVASQITDATKGVLQFEISGFNGRTWSLRVAINKPMAAPDATLAIDSDTYEQILARTLPAPQAFFSGKLKITGDMNLAMQLGMALMPQPR